MIVKYKNVFPTKSDIMSTSWILLASLILIALTTIGFNQLDKGQSFDIVKMFTELALRLIFDIPYWISILLIALFVEQFLLPARSYVDDLIKVFMIEAVAILFFWSYLLSDFVFELNLKIAGIAFLTVSIRFVILCMVYPMRFRRQDQPDIIDK